MCQIRDTFRASIQVAHFGASDIRNTDVRWEILNGSVIIASGTFTREIIPTGALTALGSMAQALSVVSKSTGSSDSKDIH